MTSSAFDFTAYLKLIKLVRELEFMPLKWFSAQASYLRANLTEDMLKELSSLRLEDINRCLGGLNLQSDDAYMVY